MTSKRKPRKGAIFKLPLCGDWQAKGPPPFFNPGAMDPFLRRGERRNKTMLPALQARNRARS